MPSAQPPSEFLTQALRRQLPLVASLFVSILCSAIDCLASEAALRLKQQGFDDERGAIRALLGNDLDTIEASSGRKADIFITRTDLDGDGTDEIVARVVHGGYCGSGGCLMVGLRRDESGAWHSILEITTVEIAVSSERTRGFRDLTIKDGHAQVHRLAWDGERYSGASASDR